MTNLDPDDIVSIDNFINELILSGKTIDRTSTQPALDLIGWYKILQRCVERRLIPREYKHTSLITLKAEILEYTGDVIQQEAIKQWVPNRHFYFCYDGDSNQDYIFSPGLQDNLSAKPGEYLVKTKEGSLSAISKNEFNNYWLLDGDRTYEES